MKPPRSRRPPKQKTSLTTVLIMLLLCVIAGLLAWPYVAALALWRDARKVPPTTFGPRLTHGEYTSRVATMVRRFADESYQRDKKVSSGLTWDQTSKVTDAAQIAVARQGWGDDRILAYSDRIGSAGRRMSRCLAAGDYAAADRMLEALAQDIREYRAMSDLYHRVSMETKARLYPGR